MAEESGRKLKDSERGEPCDDSAANQSIALARAAPAYFTPFNSARRYSTHVPYLQP